MKAQIKLFKIFGIQIGLHYSWLLIAVLVVFSLAGQFTATQCLNSLKPMARLMRLEIE